MTAWKEGGIIVAFRATVLDSLWASTLAVLGGVALASDGGADTPSKGFHREIQSDLKKGSCVG